MNNQTTFFVVILFFFILSFSACKPKEEIITTQEKCNRLIESSDDKDNIYYYYDKNDVLIKRKHVSKVSNSIITEYTFEYDTLKRIIKTNYLKRIPRNGYQVKNITEYTYSGKNLITMTIFNFLDSVTLAGLIRTDYIYESDKLVKEICYLQETLGSRKAIQYFILYTSNPNGKIATSEIWGPNCADCVVFDEIECQSDGIVSSYFYRLDNSLEKVIEESRFTNSVSEKIYNEKGEILSDKIFAIKVNPLKAVAETIYNYDYFKNKKIKVEEVYKLYDDFSGIISDVPIITRFKYETYTYNCLD